MKTNHDKLRARVDELRHANYGNMLYVDNGPEAEAFEDALEFISALPEEMVANPLIDAVDDKRLNMYWACLSPKGDMVYADVNFYGEGTYSYYALIPKTHKIDYRIGEREVPVDTLTPQLLHALQHGEVIGEAEEISSEW